LLNLVPRLISLNYSDGNLSGTIFGSVLIFDVSGFASMAETLSEQGNRGAEILSNSLNTIYTRAILSMIRGSGGFVSGFSGDSFAVILPGIPIEKAEIFGKEMLGRLALTSASSATGIEFKAGGSCGEINWGIFGRQRKGWFFSGNVFRRAYLALEKPQQGGLAIFADKSAEEEFTSLDGMSGRAPDKLLESSFFSSKLLNSESYGEFRRVFPVFLTPVSVEKDDREMIRSIAPEVINTSVETGGFWGGVHYDSKGFYFLILFGAPEAYENDLERALTFSRQLYSTTPFPVRIAVSLGTMYAGFLGFQQIGTYTVLGSQANLAARMMRYEVKSGIYLSEEVAKISPGSSKEASVRIKGMADEVNIFRLDDSVSETGRYPFEGKLLGRDPELKKITDLALKSADDCSGSIILVSAPAGTGKSHLLWQAGSILETQGFRRIHLRCDDIISRSFGPFVTFLREYFQQKKDSSFQKNQASFKRIFNVLSDRIRTRYPDRVQELKRTKSFLSALLMIDMPGSLYHQVGPEGKQENTIAALRELILAIAQTEPLFMVIDDIQWLDDTSESVVRSLSRSLDNIPIVLALAARTLDDGSRIEVPSEKDAVVINLDPLHKQTLPELVREIMGGLPDYDLESFLAVQSGMNPFYLRQYAAYLVESNSIMEKNGVITLTASPEKIPRGITDLLTARIDRLSVDLKNVVRTASVLGFEFNARILSAMLAGRELTPLLSNGAEEKLWSSVSEILYIFQHGLLRETAYSMQLESELIKLHSIAACAIENIYPGDEAYFPDLAYHWDKARDSETACFYLEKVLHAASKSGDVKLSYKCAKRLRELLENLPGREEQLISAMLKEIQILGIFARCREAVELAMRTEDIALAAKDRKRYAEAMGMRAWITSRLGDLKTALELNEKALEIHNELGYLKGIYESTGYLAAIKFMTGHVSESRKLFEKQLRIFTEMKDFDESNAKVYNNMACTAVDPDEKQEILEKAIDVALQHKDKRLHSVSLGNLAEVFHKKNQFDMAENAYRKALEIAREIGDRYYISYHSCGLAILKTDSGDYDQAEEMLQEYYETSRDIGIRYGEAEALGYMGVVLLRKGELKRALSTFDEALLILRELDYAHYIYIFQADRARTLFRLGRLPEAEAALLESNTLIENQEKPEPLPENDSLQQRIHFDTAGTAAEKLNCIRSLHKMISQTEDPVSNVIPVNDLWEMLKIPIDDLPEEFSHAVIRNEFIRILDRAALDKPTYEIISIRDKIKGDRNC